MNSTQIWTQSTAQMAWQSKTFWTQTTIIEITFAQSDTLSVHNESTHTQQLIKQITDHEILPFFKL